MMLPQLAEYCEYSESPGEVQMMDSAMLLCQSLAIPPAAHVDNVRWRFEDGDVRVSVAF